MKFPSWHTVALFIGAVIDRPGAPRRGDAVENYSR
jgi:hypothetical protein